ncbi:hypothetical protein H0H93_003634 [Arthromyces matolae]|nr:hypothetical protein H0H93_003634 [Arthromyces matolae]
MLVTQQEGNMINSLNDTNPTQLLLSAIRQSGMDMNAAGSFKDDETFLLGTDKFMYRITAGDPSRGNISLEAQNVAPPNGTSVQFFHLPKSALKQTLERHTKLGIEFVVSSESVVPDITADCDEGDDMPLRTEKSFIASSENGFVIQRAQDANAQTSMGQSSSRQSRPSSSSALPPSPLTSTDEPQPTPQPTTTPAVESSTPRRRSVRNSLLSLVRPSLPSEKQPRQSRSWRKSRRWSKAPEIPDTIPAEQSSACSSSSTIPLDPLERIEEKGKGVEQEIDDNDDIASHDQAPEASSSTAASSDRSLPSASEPIVVVDDNATPADLLDSPEHLTPETTAEAVPLSLPPPPSSATTTTPPQQQQFPPPGTLVVVQGVVHTTDVPRPLVPPSSDPPPPPPPPPRPSSTPPTARNRLSTLFQSSRPPSRASFTPSFNTIDPTQTVEDIAPPSPAPTTETGPISSGSIDVLGTLLSVAAAATAASLLTGSTEPLHLPSSINTSPAPTTLSTGPYSARPTSPTPTSGLDATRAERLRQAWGGIRERLGLRPHSNPSTTPSPSPSSSPSGTDSSADPREQLFGQMARAFNLGLGLATESPNPGTNDAPIEPTTEPENNAATSETLQRIHMRTQILLKLPLPRLMPKAVSTAGQGIPAALLPQTPISPTTQHSASSSPPSAPLDPTLAELPFANDVLEPQQQTHAPSHTVVPVIVVGVQSVAASNWPATNGAVDPMDDGLGMPSMEPPSPAPDAAPTEGSRGQNNWQSRAAEAFRNLRPGRRPRAPPTTTVGSRTFLIYVIGGYYPPNHSILSGGPETLASLEALLELADLLGHSKPPTATKEEIEKSGLELIKSAQLEQYEREERISANCIERCLICLDDYHPEDDIRVMNCKHAFHQMCVDKWLETGRNNCPACRSKGVSLDGADA